MQLLTSLFGAAILCALVLIFPIRNTVESQERPWATWILIGVSLIIAVAVLIGDLLGGGMELANRVEPFVFTGDPSTPWQLVTAPFVNVRPVEMLILLWLLYLIAPPLEDKLGPVGLILLFVIGGAAAYAVYGVLSHALGAKPWLAGLAPSFCALLGCYFVLYPFRDIVFFYNFLFFAFTGTTQVATFYLVLFAVVVEAISGISVVATLFAFGRQVGREITWTDEAAALAGLGIGMIAGAIRFGFGAFVGRESEDDAREAARRRVERALSRIDRRGAATESDRPLNRREQALVKEVLQSNRATPEMIEAFAQECLTSHRDRLLGRAYERLRELFPQRCFGPGLQAAMARRFEQTGRIDEAIEAYRRLIQSFGETPVAGPCRLSLARLLVRDRTAPRECLDLLEDFLAGKPARDAADEARLLLEQARETTTPDDAYEGLGPHKTFRFRNIAGAPAATEATAEARTPLPRKRIGRSAREILPPDEPEPVAGPAQDFPLFEPPIVLPVDEPERPRDDEPAAARDASGVPRDAPSTRDADTGELVPESHGMVLRQWGRPSADPERLAAAMASARSCAVILLPRRSPITEEARRLLAGFWSLNDDQAAEWLRACRGVLLDDVPAGRAVVATRKLRALGLPAATVPILPELVFGAGQDVLELDWSDAVCGNVTPSGRVAVEWSDIRMVNLARVGLRGGGAAYRLVLDLFASKPRMCLRYWETTLNYHMSRLSGRPVVQGSLSTLAEYLDARAPRALKTPSFLAAAKKSGPPLDFHCPDELDHYNRWFLYAGYGIYSMNE